MIDVPSPLGRVCIVMMSAVGDAVHVLPVINALKRHSPGVQSPGCCSRHPRRSFEATGRLMTFSSSIEPRASRRSPTFGASSPDARVRSRHQSPGVLQGRRRDAFTRAPVKLGFDRARARDCNWLFTTHRIPPHAPQHVQDQYFEFLTALGLPHEPVEWDLGPWPHERPWQREFLAQFDRPVAPIVVATSKPQKDWLPERWAEVVDALWHDFGLAARARRRTIATRAPGGAHHHGARSAHAALRARQRSAQARRDSRRSPRSFWRPIPVRCTWRLRSTVPWSA